MTNPHQELLQFARQALKIPETATLRMEPVGKGGSVRSFHRIRYGSGGSAILMHYDRNQKENNYYAAIADFLRHIDVPVPLIMAHSPEQGHIVMEDLGDDDLWSFRHEPWETRREYYHKTLSAIRRLHTFPVKGFPSKKVSLMEQFGPKLYRWERNYFLENFVQGVCGLALSPSKKKSLEAELKGLSDRLDNVKPGLVHRDFQSQNIMIRGGKPVLIDFQGMRFGNLFYDLGSLLYDPYVLLDEKERTALLLYYYRLWTSGKNTLPLLWTYFLEMFHEASVQRLMQALGAYGFLGLKRGISGFLNHIPNGIANLIDAALRTKKLPLLTDLALSCQHTLKKRK